MLILWMGGLLCVVSDALSKIQVDREDQYMSMEVIPGLSLSQQAGDFRVSTRARGAPVIPEVRVG